MPISIVLLSEVEQDQRLGGNGDGKANVVERVLVTASTSVIHSKNHPFVTNYLPGTQYSATIMSSFSKHNFQSTNFYQKFISSDQLVWWVFPRSSFLSKSLRILVSWTASKFAVWGFFRPTIWSSAWDFPSPIRYLSLSGSSGGLNLMQNLFIHSLTYNSLDLWALDTQKVIHFLGLTPLITYWCLC